MTLTNFKRHKPIKKYLRGGCSCGWDPDKIQYEEFIKNNLVEWEFEDYGEF